jgi:hypothetical protein
MEKIKIKVADWESVVSSKRDENEEKSYEKGVDFNRICGCCGKEIKNFETAKSLHLIEGGSYFTEDEREKYDGTDMGWWITGPTCYKKFLKNIKEVEIEID